MSSNVITINLEFDKATTRLAYYPYGQEVYEMQVAPKVDLLKDDVCIVFPDQIIKVASSFVQGFFKIPISELGYDAIGRQIKVKSNNEGLVESILENLI